MDCVKVVSSSRLDIIALAQLTNPFKMSKDTKPGDNFQQFLELLSDIEKEEDLQSAYNNDKTNVSCEISSCQKDERKAEKNEELRRKVLRRPGFVYRNKTNKTSLLDNNLWEFRCGQRILKSPSFKYCSKRTSILSPYSLHVLDDMSGLSLTRELKPKQSVNLASKEISPTINWFKKSSSSILRTCNDHIKTFEEKTVTNFIPLSDSGQIVTSFGKVRGTSAKRKRQLIRSPRLKLHNVNLPEIKEQESEQTESMFSCSSANMPSYSDLAKLKKSCPKAEKKLSHLGVKNSPNFKKFRSNSLRTDLRKTSTSPFENSCSYQARRENDISVDELSLYVEDFLVLPQKMSTMAEMMYT